MKNLLIAILGLGIGPAALAQPCGDLSSLQWLVGDWSTSGKDRIILESWEQTSALTFEGNGLTLSNSGEEISREWLRLLAMKNQIFYLAKVDQNALPTPFQLTRCSDTRFIFQNPEHDFPKVIIYDKKGDDALAVTISDGESRSMVFEFTKQK